MQAGLHCGQTDHQCIQSRPVRQTNSPPHTVLVPHSRIRGYFHASIVCACTTFQCAHVRGLALSAFNDLRFRVAIANVENFFIRVRHSGVRVCACACMCVCILSSHYARVCTRKYVYGYDGPAETPLSVASLFLNPTVFGRTIVASHRHASCMGAPVKLQPFGLSYDRGGGRRGAV